MKGGVLGQVFASIFQGASQAKQAHADYQAQWHSQMMQQQHQKEMAEYAYAKDLEQWHRQNEYNTPAMQMDRFKGAGLNPHLIYGQGNSGNAASTVNYKPPHLQWQLDAPQTGAALQTIIPTLMQVGTWMQDMKLSEVQIDRQKSEAARTEDLVGFLRSRYPKELQKLDNELFLFPHQRDYASYKSAIAAHTASGLEKELRYKYGDYPWENESPKGGVRRLQFLEQLAKTKLAGAKSAWTDVGLTDPQAIIQMVLGGVMSMAGQTTRPRLSTHRRIRK